MKVLSKNPELCIQCHACESACSNTWFKEDNAEKSCIKVNDDNGKAKITVCTQCGECMAVCPVQALTRDANGVVRVNKKICVGCFICVGYCPEVASAVHGMSVHAMGMHSAHIEPFKCVVCGQCAKQCPTKAIFVEDK